MTKVEFKPDDGWWEREIKKKEIATIKVKYIRKMNDDGIMCLESFWSIINDALDFLIKNLEYKRSIEIALNGFKEKYKDNPAFNKMTDKEIILYCIGQINNID